MPKDQQLLLSMHEDIQIAFDIRWTNSEFKHLINETGLIFQNVIQSFQFSPSTQTINPVMTAMREAEAFESETTII